MIMEPLWSESVAQTEKQDSQEIISFTISIASAVCIIMAIGL